MYLAKVMQKNKESLMTERCQVHNSNVFHFYNCRCVYPSVCKTLPCLSLSFPLATCLSKALLSVVYTEDIKWPAFTKMLELLLKCCCISGCTGRWEDISKEGGKQKKNVDKRLWLFSVPQQRCRFRTCRDLQSDPPYEDLYFTTTSLILPLI